MGRFVYLPFFVVTLIQMLGNIFFSFTFIDESSQTFQDWINMVGGLFENMGIDKNDLNTHKTILSFLTGGLLPIISLTFAHMLVKFSENQKNESSEKVNLEEKPVIVDLPELIAKKQEEDENLKYTPTKEDLDKLEQILKRYSGPEEKINDSQPVVLNDEQLKELEIILNKKQDKLNEEVKTDNTDETIESNIVENVEETIIESQPEPVNEVLNIENRNPYENEDKKKIDDETKEVSDYKILNYTKNV
jgi:dsDNA-binding SOS-regulon protein